MLLLLAVVIVVVVVAVAVVVVVGIANGYWLEDRAFGVQVPIGSRIFSSSHR
jgi:hypothetical protein